MWSNARGCPRVNRLHRQRPASGVQLQSRAATASANDMVCRSGPRGARRNSPLAALDSSPLVRLVHSLFAGRTGGSSAAARSPVMPSAAVGILQASSASSPFTSMPRTKLRTGAVRSGNAIQSCDPEPARSPARGDRRSSGCRRGRRSHRSRAPRTRRVARHADSHQRSARVRKEARSRKGPASTCALGGRDHTVHHGWSKMARALHVDLERSATTPRREPYGLLPDRLHRRTSSNSSRASPSGGHVVASSVTVHDPGHLLLAVCIALLV